MIMDLDSRNIMFMGRLVTNRHWKFYICLSNRNTELLSAFFPQIPIKICNRNVTNLFNTCMVHSQCLPWKVKKPLILSPYRFVSILPIYLFYE